MSSSREQLLDSVAFIGETLGPLFLYEPTDERNSAIIEALSGLDVNSAAADWPFVAQGAAESSLDALATGLTESQEDDLLWEYRRLFVGPGIKPCPPWGSVYMDRECVVFGESTLALRSWMRENGIARPGDGTEPEDHIGFMLMLMAWLARSRDELLDEYLQNHLLTWAFHYLEQLEAASGHPFFRGLAQLTADSLEGIQDEFGIEVEVPRFYR